ncbi:sugar ABC transporter substrate-binding protein [Pendulispora brunnea]|uniref:Sugar ABC transporter substrate-binding protein n=1 Tax=Pendulispora brunnea TaxID=2905690 RepID=A0ABZ2KHC4_9BACT
MWVLRRRHVAASFLVLAASLVSACKHGESGGDKKVTLGLAVANLQADFFNQIKTSVEAEAAAKGVAVVVADAKGDATTQVNQIQDFITRQVDAIIYIPAGATAAGVPVKAARDAKIPVVTVDRNPPDQPGDSFIATDSVAAAKALGEYVVRVTGAKGNVAILQGQIGTTPEIARDTGFSSALGQAPGLRVIAQQSADWDQDKAFSVAQNMLQANPQIDVFFGRADAMALGAAQAVRAAGTNRTVKIVGFDGDVAGLKGVRDGVIDATMCQQTQKMGRMSVDTALALLRKESVPKEQLQDAFLVTKDNAAQYLEKHP